MVQYWVRNNAYQKRRCDLACFSDRMLSCEALRSSFAMLVGTKREEGTVKQRGIWLFLSVRCLH